MSEYHVVWEIDVDANSPREAAEIAWEIQRDPESYPPIFEVKDMKTGTSVNVDLTKEDT